MLDPAASPEIVLIGAAHLDRRGKIDGNTVLGASNPGQFSEMPGGAALNVASVLAAMEVRTRLLGIVGEDTSGTSVAQCATARGIEVHLQRNADHATASYTSVLASSGDLIIALADMAIYEQFDPSPACNELSKHQPGGWVLTDANLPTSALEAICATGKAHRAAMTVSVAKAPRLMPVLHRVNVLFTNRAEAAALCGTSDENDMDRIGQCLTQLGTARAVISNGPRDIAVLEDGKLTFHANQPVTDIVDVTGAGDALTAGCLYGLMHGHGLADSLAHGQRAASAVLQVEGPWHETLSAKFAAQLAYERTQSRHAPAMGS